MRRALAFLLLPLLAGAALADEKPSAGTPTAYRATDAVIEAFGASDEAALTALAARDEPDPWLVAEELCRRGSYEAATAFAKAAVRPLTAGLAVAIATRQVLVLSEAEVAALEDLRQARLHRDAPGALAAAATLAAITDPWILAILHHVVGAAHQVGGAVEPAAAAYERAAKAAEACCWLRRADDSHHLRARLLAGHGRHDDAIQAYAARMTISKRLDDTAAMAISLVMIAQIHEAAGRIEPALARTTEAAALFEEAGALASWSRALALLARLEVRAGDPAAALAHTEQALELALKAKEPELVAKWAFNLHIAYERTGRLDDALRAMRTAVAAAEEAGAGALLVMCLRALSDAARGVGALQDALAAARRAVPLAEHTPDPLDDVRALGARGQAALELGDLDAAEEDFRASQARAQAAGFAEGIVQAALSLGALQHARGRLAEALSLYEQAAQLAKAAGDSQKHHSALNNQAMVRNLLGDHEAAARLYAEALAQARAAGDRVAAGSYSLNLGLVHLNQDDRQRAEACFTDALTVAREAGSRPVEARALTNLGLVANKRLDYETALGHLRAAAEIKEAMGDHASIAYTLLAIGDTHRGRHEPEEALVVYADVMRRLDEAGDRYPLHHALHRIAMAHSDRAEYAKAVEYAERAIAKALELTHGLGDQEGARARDLWVDLCEHGQSAAMSAGDVPAVFRFLEGARAVGLLEILEARASLREALVPKDVRRALRAAEWAEAQAVERLARVRATGRFQAVRQARERVEDARRAHATAVERLQREATRAAAVVQPTPDKLEDVQARLSPDTAMVLYSFVRTQALALVIRRENVRAVPLAPREKILAACDRLLLGGAPHVEPAGAAALKRLLIDALDLPEAVTQLLVCPTGRLGYVPFELLVGGRQVAYVPSATVHGTLLAAPQPSSTRVLALGDPDYTLVAAAVPRRDARLRLERLQRLPATAEEARRVGDVVLLGADATEAGLSKALRAAARWRALHLACHGLVDTAHPMGSALALSPDATSDGMLTYLEIFGLEVPADLVVLSACETAKGRIFLTEGIVGLTRAFMYAGAPRVICSLWKVDDEATQALMLKFYELWNPQDGSRGLGAAAALKRAQAFVAGHEKWAHPYFWAAWVLWGLPE